MSAPSSDLAVLLSSFDQAFDKKSWHGTNLRGSIRGLSAVQADWRPHPGRHSIADIVLHAAYWKYTVRRRLLGLQRGSFALKGSNWFKLPQPVTEPDWRGYVALLETEHHELRTALVSLTTDQLAFTPRGSKVSNLALIQGIVAHDVYHAGQIQLLKRLNREA